MIVLFFRRKRKAVHQKVRSSKKLKATKVTSTTAAADISDKVSKMSVGENNGKSQASVSSIQYRNAGPIESVSAHGKKTITKSKSNEIASGASPAVVGKSPVDLATFTNEVNEANTSQDNKNKSVLGRLLGNFPVDDSTYSLAQIRATFYPKFENEKSDQEVICLHLRLLFFFLVFQMKFV